MTDNLKAIYRILSSLESQMDNAHVDVSKFDYEQLGISEERWAKYLEMMQDAGYIKGCIFRRNLNDDLILNVDNISITLGGLEYLQENTVMQRMYKATKGIVELVP